MRNHDSFVRISATSMLVTKFYDTNFKILVTDLFTPVTTRGCHHVEYFVINMKMVINLRSSTSGTKCPDFFFENGYFKFQF